MTKRLMRVPIAALAVGLLAAGCSSAKATSGAAATGPLEKTNLIVAAVPAADAAGLYIAQQRGLFAAQGLHVKIETAVSGATTIAGQLKGQIDVSMGNYVSYLLADSPEGNNPAARQDPLEILTAGSVMQANNQVMLVRRGSPIHSVADLKGKRIGVNVPDNIGFLLISALLKANGLLPSQVHFVRVDFPNMGKAIEDHTVDAAWMPDPFVTANEEQYGEQPLADLNQGAVAGLPIAGYIVTKNWAKANPNTAAAFRRAVIEGQRIADSNRTAVQDGVLAFAPGVTRQVVALLATADYPVDTDPVPIQRVADLMLQFHVLSKPLTVGPYIYKP
jgi:NitT/TauT family transport system substrate-binding protein